MKIYLYLHTHWDQEWYFSNATANVLFKNNLDFYLSQTKKINNFYLDGAWAIVDNYLETASKKQAKKFLKHVKKQKWNFGPWYIQPDVYNCKIETLIRNLELGLLLSSKYKLANSCIMYCPDTFGFSNNLINLFDIYNFKYFLFWRGLNHQIKSDLFL